MGLLEWVLVGAAIGSILAGMLLLGIFRNMTYRRKIRYFERASG